MVAGAPSILEQFAQHYRQRDLAVREWRATGKRVIGYLGSDTPEELIIAAGMLPFRLAGNPSGAMHVTQRYLEQAGDPVILSVLNGLLEGEFPYLDGLVIARDVESHVLLFQTLRELQRVEPVSHLPNFWLLDLLHLPYRTSQTYNRLGLRELRETLARWAGHPIGDESVRLAIARCNESRRLLQQVAALRAADPPRLSGVEALRVIGASMVMSKPDHTRLVRTLLDDRDSLAPHPGVRVFLTGSSHDHTGFYELLEAHGAVVVGEDHDWGNRWFSDFVDETADPIDALADAYQFGSPASAKYGIVERATYTADQAVEAHADVVIAFIHAGDDAPAWDFAHQRAQLAERGIPAFLIAEQPYRLESSPDLVRLVEAILETVAQPWSDVRRKEHEAQPA
jgi:benzoyl-CoA reductase/2-hydroxyglutaryl-CoA dehydratase subunit BcrC/BadD/HgdB